MEFIGWGEEASLLEGFPRFFVGGSEVERAVYEGSAANDPSLPPYRVADDAPFREFPEEIKRSLRR